jgi:hypothetical protein
MHHVRPRDEYQELLGRANPSWEEIVREAKGGKEIKTNPDGDVRRGISRLCGCFNGLPKSFADLPRSQVDLRGVRYDQFVVPGCQECEKLGIKDSIVKPNVVFFGETISDEVRDRASV